MNNEHTYRCVFICSSVHGQKFNEQACLFICSFICSFDPATDYNCLSTNSRRRLAGLRNSPWSVMTFLPTRTGWVASRLVARIEHGPDGEFLLLDDAGETIAVTDIGLFDPDRRDGCCHE